MSHLRVWLLVMLVGWVWLAVPLDPPASEATEKDSADHADFNGDGFADLAVKTRGVLVLYGSPDGLTAAGNQLWTKDTPGIVGSPGGGFGQSMAVGDFNGDGFGDLAVGAPYGVTAEQPGPGAVHVIYGSGVGLTAAGNQAWSQNSPGVPGTEEDNDAFGASLAAANVGNSDHDDLLVGVPGEDVGHVVDAGAVQVLYGSADGLTSTGSRLWTQNTTGIRSRAETGDGFGCSLAAGNLGQSDHADLAVGSCGEDVGKLAEAGVVHVLFGSAAGLSSSDSQMWTLNSPGVRGVAEAGGDFGASLAIADFGRDGHADLAVGVPDYGIRLSRRDEDNDSEPAGFGAVAVLYGSTSGLRSAGSELWSRASTGIKGVPEEFDLFGASLAAADLGRSLHADLVVGVPYELGGGLAEGAVNVIYGSAAGLTAAGDQIWSSASEGVKGDPNYVGEFGWSLAAGNFGKSGTADLAIGEPNATVGGTEHAGVVHILYSSPDTGLTPAGDQLWSHATRGIPGEPGQYWGFGDRLVAAP